MLACTAPSTLISCSTARVPVRANNRQGRFENSFCRLIILSQHCHSRAAVIRYLSAMNDEPPFQLTETKRARKRAQRLFESVSGLLQAVLPANADIRHIGAMAVLGWLTKGDLDIVIRVPPDDFQPVDALLAARIARNDGSVKTESFSAFEDASSDPHLGIQLTVIGGPYDFFHQFVEALGPCPHLVEEYNTLKRFHDGGDMTVYRTAKDEFVERVLADFYPYCGGNA